MNRPQKILSQFRKPSVLSLSLLIILIVYLVFDKWIAEHIAKYPEVHLNSWIKAYTHYGKSWPYLVILPGTLMVLFFSKHWQRFKEVLFVVSCFLVTGLTVDVIKITLGRARPSLWLTEHVYGMKWFTIKVAYMSFPSGHTSVVMSLGMALSVLYPRSSPVFLLASTTLAISRVLLLEHFLSDIMAATLISVLVVSALKAKYDQGAFDKLITKSKALARS